MTALPGTPSIQNLIPAEALGTPATAAPELGIPAAVVMFALGWSSSSRSSASVGAALAPRGVEVAQAIHCGAESSG